MNFDNTNTLESLNKAFQKEKKRKRKAAQIRRRKKHRRKVFVTRIIVLAVIAAVFFLCKAYITKSDAADAQSSENKNKKQEWESTSVNEDEVYIKVNTQWNISAGDTKIYLNLINPPYSAYVMKVKLYEINDSETTLYESEKTTPGTVIEYADLSRALEEGQHKIIIHFYFYEGVESNEVFGEYKIEANITVAE